MKKLEKQLLKALKRLNKLKEQDNNITSIKRTNVSLYKKNALHQKEHGMKRYLIKIEFRYKKVHRKLNRSPLTSETIALGVTDTFNEACIVGNMILEVLENRFAIKKTYDGNFAPKQRFSKDGFLGTPVTLISDMGYLNTPFNFFVEIEKLNFTDNITDKINKIVGEIDEYNKH